MALAHEILHTALKLRAFGGEALFISFEGGEGAGKTTQALRLVERLRDQGYDVELVREPGGTSLGTALREYAKSNKPLTALAELHLFIAARAELVAEKILPALKSGAIVVADRFADSTVAYQGFGRGLKLEHIVSLNRSATQNRTPDLTFLLRVPPETALQRVRAPTMRGSPPQLSLQFQTTGEGLVRSDGEGHRFESEALGFHQRVHSGYLEIAAKEPERWVVLEGTQGPSILADTIWAEVVSRLAVLQRQVVPPPEHPLFR